MLIERFGTQSESQDLPIDPIFLEIVVHQNRGFQKYALDNSVYFAPVDEVDLPEAYTSLAALTRIADTENRTKASVFK